MSLKLYDYQCIVCNHVFEELGDDNAVIYCKKCGCYTKRIISVPGGTNANQDADWIRSVCEVVDKDGGPHCQELLKYPTRDNYKKWMKVEGIRPYEEGEGVRRPPPVDTERIDKEVWEKHQERNRIEI